MEGFVLAGTLFFIALCGFWVGVQTIVFFANSLGVANRIFSVNTVVF